MNQFPRSFGKILGVSVAASFVAAGILSNFEDRVRWTVPMSGHGKILIDGNFGRSFAPPSGAGTIERRSLTWTEMGREGVNAWGDFLMAIGVAMFVLLP